MFDKNGIMANWRLALTDLCIYARLGPHRYLSRRYQCMLLMRYTRVFATHAAGMLALNGWSLMRRSLLAPTVVRPRDQKNVYKASSDSDRVPNSATSATFDDFCMSWCDLAWAQGRCSILALALSPHCAPPRG